MGDELWSRLKSIEEDSLFVSKVSQLFPNYKLVANERCGTWYIPPQNLHHETVYFMSKDGHIGKWELSLRRLNLHLFDLFQQDNGCIIIDSTRKGKQIPDSFSKTIPIWCCCFNQALYNIKKQVGIENWDLELHVPFVVGDEEKRMIKEKIPEFVKQLMETGINFENISQKLLKPLKPIWITPQTDIDQLLLTFQDLSFTPVICLTSSAIYGTDQCHREDYTYIQGAGDDHETWSFGLTPKLFWKHSNEILHSPKENCKQIVQTIVSNSRKLMCVNEQNDHNQIPSWSKIGETRLFIGNIFSGKPPNCWNSFDAILNCSDIPLGLESDDYDNYLFLQIPSGKKGRYDYLKKLSQGTTFVVNHLKLEQNVLICCEDGNDLSVAFCLCILVQHFDEKGNFHDKTLPTESINKNLIRRRLRLISENRHMASPSRTLLRTLNSHLMSQEFFPKTEQDSTEIEIEIKE